MDADTSSAVYHCLSSPDPVTSDGEGAAGPKQMFKRLWTKQKTSKKQ